MLELNSISDFFVFCKETANPYIPKRLLSLIQKIKDIVHSGWTPFTTQGQGAHRDDVQMDDIIPHDDASLPEFSRPESESELTLPPPESQPPYYPPEEKESDPLTE